MFGFSIVRTATLEELESEIDRQDAVRANDARLLQVSADLLLLSADCLESADEQIAALEARVNDLEIDLYFERQSNDYLADRVQQLEDAAEAVDLECIEAAPAPGLSD